MAQFAFQLELPTSFSEASFSVSASNAQAWKAVTAWPEWDKNALLIYGPSGSGKSHLAHIWSARANALLCDAATGIPQPDAITGNMLLEHADKTPDERTLLHVLNSMHENNHALLLTATQPPKLWDYHLPDLTSRLLALPCAPIAEPDDALLMAVMRKQFSDRQLKISDEAIVYLLPRIERSFAHVRALVESIDKQALSAHKNLTIPFLKQTLGY